jgi:hypothetical protein
LYVEAKADEKTHRHISQVPIRSHPSIASGCIPDVDNLPHAMRPAPISPSASVRRGQPRLFKGAQHHNRVMRVAHHLMDGASDSLR